MVVVHKVQAVLPEPLGHGLIQLQKLIVVFLHVSLPESMVAAQTHIAAVHGQMLPAHRVGLAQKPVGLGMGAGADQAVGSQLFLHPRGVIVTYTGQLHRGVANVRNLLQSLSQVFCGLAEFSYCVKLCTDLHTIPSKIFFKLAAA